MDSDVEREARLAYERKKDMTVVQKTKRKERAKLQKVKRAPPPERRLDLVRVHGGSSMGDQSSETKTAIGRVHREHRKYRGNTKYREYTDTTACKTVDKVQRI